MGQTGTAENGPLRVGLVADLREEHWPSMDLVADMLERDVPRVSGGAVTIEPLRSPFVRRLRRDTHTQPSSVDRVINRFWDFPRWLRRRAGDFDVFHVADHSYAHLVHVLPADRTVVFCHDADAFMAFFGDRRHPSLLPRIMSRRVLDGLRRAARVLCISASTRDTLHEHHLVDPSRTEIVPLGVHPSCTPQPDPAADRLAAELLGPEESTDIVHVGSTIPRKRIDVLLRVLASLVPACPRVRLLRVGGPFTPEQFALAASLGVDHRIVHLPHLERPTLASIYRRADAVLLTSEREGFGLPIVEALACGTPVVASDIPVCREVGGDAVTYCPLGDGEQWRSSVLELVAERHRAPDRREARRARGFDRARAFSWDEVARRSVNVYRHLAS